MLAQFLIAFLLFGGMLACVGGFIYLLVFSDVIGAIRKPWKEEWLNIGEYKLLSITDKLKYHKHKGNIAEHIEIKQPLIFLVSSIFSDLFCKYKFHKEEGGEFYLDKHGKFYADYPDVIKSTFKNICTKIADGVEINLSVDPQYTGIRIIVNDEVAGHVIGFDNVVEWNDLTYREEVMKVIDKLNTKKLPWNRGK